MGNKTSVMPWYVSSSHKCVTATILCSYYITIRNVLQQILEQISFKCVTKKLTFIIKFYDDSLRN